MIIYYFSGTGNTIKIANKIVDVLNEHYIKSELIMINSQTNYKNTTEPICLLFPINAHAMSPFIWKFIKNLPQGDGRDILVFYSYNNSAAVGEPIKKILNNKDYCIRVLKGIQMPNHLIIHEDDAKDNKKRYEEGMKLVTKTLEAYLNGQCIIDFKTNGSKLLSFINLNTSIIWRLMRLVSKLEIQKEKCKNCGYCKKQCPVNNIVNFNDGYKYKNNCQLCMLCMSDCPNNAIRIKRNHKIKLIK